MTAKDPLISFRRWEGHPNELGVDKDDPPGIHGQPTLGAQDLHIAGAHAEAVGMPTLDDQLPRHVPGVRLSLLAGAYTTGPRYHVVDAFIDSDVALQLAEVLRLTAWRARIDIAVAAGAITPEQAAEYAAQLRTSAEDAEADTEIPDEEAAAE